MKRMNAGNEAKHTVCLVMIVKNEHHVLQRSLDSVRGLIDTWLIVDTGSTDGTQQLIRDYFKDLPGELIERPWVNFGHNRTESVQYARGKADYLLLMDADEYLETENGFSWPPLSADAYDFQMHTTSIDYYRIQLVRSSLPWHYVGVAHEYITCERDHAQEHMPGLRTIRRQEGARSKDPLAYHKDALLLEEALLTEPGNSRHMFYLAQSYRDAKLPEAAIDRYRRRIAMGGWVEEVWCSHYQIARLLQGKGAPWAEVLDAYLAAYSCRASRAEPLYHIGMHYQTKQNYQASLLFFAQALQISYPKEDTLFVDWEIYRFLLPLEYAVACYWLNRHEEAIAITDRLMADPARTPEQLDHLRRNRAFSVEALIAEGKLAPNSEIGYAAR